MEEWIEVGAADMLPSGAMQQVEVQGRDVLLARVGETYYATQARCPHLRARLARGQLEGAIVTCPGHGSTFDVTTGRNVSWIAGLPGLVRDMAQAFSKPQDLEVFAVQVEEGRVWIKSARP
jgi:nitrite reductase/ring-hydroxylating ferredoxin subunit